MTFANPSRVVGTQSLQSVGDTRVKDCSLSNVDADGRKERESSKYQILLTGREIFVGAPTNRVPRSVVRLAASLVYRWFDVNVYVYRNRPSM